jgi:predicted ATPase/DNA-binding CsgD family transcriptional regulator
MPNTTDIRSMALIGRDAELQHLRRVIETACAGRGQVLLVSGEAGIGKSRLILEALSLPLWEKAGASVMTGRCYEQDRNTPFAPFVELLRQNLTALQDLSVLQQGLPQLLKLAPELAARFPNVQLAPVVEPEQEKHNLLRTWVSLFSANPNPTLQQVRVIVLEDLHWCDEVSLDLTLTLARRIVDQSALLMLTYRNDEITPTLSHFLAAFERERLAHEILLKRLAAEHTRAIIRAIFNQVLVRDEFLNAIQARTDGNPFFIEETLKALVSGGDIYTERGVWTRKPMRELSIPRTVQDAVQRRAQTLSEQAKRVLAAAAVAGQHFQFVLLREVTSMNEDELLASMRELIAAQLLVEYSADEFAFRHALTHEAAYASLLKRERRRLHRAVGDALRKLGATTGALAYHLFEAEMWDDALSYAREAGEQAQRLFAPHEAVEHFTRAIEAANALILGPSPSPSPIAIGRGELYRARAQAHETLGHFDEANADYEAANAEAQAFGDKRAEWENLFSLGFLWTGRDMSKAGAYLDRALDLTRQLNDLAALGASLNRIGNWRMNMEQSDEALRLHHEALSLFEPLDDRAGLALTHDLLGITHMIRGDYVASVHHHDRAIAHFRALDNRTSLSSTLGTAAMRGGSYQGDISVFAPASVETCWQLGSEAIQIARQIGWRAGEANANAYLALAMGVRGAYARSLQCARDALDIALDIDAIWEGVAHIAFGKTHHDCLSLDSARMHFEQAATYARRVGAAEFLNTAASFLVSTLIAGGELTEARKLLAELPNIPPAQTQTTSQRLIACARAELLLAERRWADALGVIGGLMEVAPHTADGKVVPRLWLLRAEALTRLNRLGEAEVVLHVAARAAADHDLKPMLWRIQVALGKQLRSRRKHDEAQTQFDQARAVIAALASDLPDELLRESLRCGFEAMLPDSPTPLQTAKRAFDGLTAREREVAALVSQGKTNKAIAEQLIVSERTVEKHVENAMGKLGFTSRSQLAVWATERRLSERAAW